MASEWGRKETVIWPPHQPVYTYLAAALTLLCTAMIAWQCLHYQAPLQKAYMGDYLRAEAGAAFDLHGKYRLFYVAGPSQAPRLAVPLDFTAGETEQPGGMVPMRLSDTAITLGYQSFSLGPATGYRDASLARWYRAALFGGKGLWQVYGWYFLEAVPVLIVALYLSIPADRKRYLEMKYGRVLRGPRMMTPGEFCREHQGDGIGFKTAERRGLMQIPAQKEAQHFQFMGDTGTGKTQLIKQLLRQIRDRGELAIVYDPAGEFVKNFFDRERGDWVLNPLDERCPSWGPANELESNAEADAIAASLYQPGPESVGKDEFFHKTPAKIFAHLLKQGPSTEQLAGWMASREELERLTKGTELAFFIDRSAGPQSTGVLSSLGLVADCFRLLPERSEDRPQWSARSWAKSRKGWVFITSRRTHRDTLRPLHSLWIDLLVMRLQDPPGEEQKKVWFVIDELASLQRLPQLHTAITENRKSQNPLVIGFQGKSQLETIYGALAKTILSQSATKAYLKTAEPDAAKWISDAIGDVEIERVKETKFDGSRSGKNFTLDRQIERLVLPSEITGLSDRHAFLKLGNAVVRFSFDYLDLPARTEAFIARSWPGGDLAFDPDTLQPKAAKPKPEAAAAKPKPLPQDAAEAGEASRPPHHANKPANPETASPAAMASTVQAEPPGAEEAKRQAELVPAGTAGAGDHHAVMDRAVIQEGLIPTHGHHF